MSYDYARWTLPQLETELKRLDAEIEQRRERKRAVARAHSDKLIAAEAVRKLAAMSDAERAALAQHLQPDAVPSAERVGGLIGRLKRFIGAE